jgi:hypothetical protein
MSFPNQPQTEEQYAEQAYYEAAQEYYLPEPVFRKRNWFARHKVLTGIGALAIIGFANLGGNSGGATEPPAPVSIVAEQSPAIDDEISGTEEVVVDDAIVEEVIVEEATSEEVVVEVISSTNTEWKAFLVSYEEFVDDYVVLMKRMSNDPTNLSVAMDALSFASKSVDLAEKADQIEDDLTGADLVEYSATMTRILAKLASVI